VNATPFGALSVARTPEIARIAALPRRTWSPEAASELAALLTRELKTPGGTMELRPVQAVALYEAMEVGGLFGPMRVGAGKTLCTALLPAALEAKRPILLLPAALIEKTVVEFKHLREHWRIATNLQIISYESLGLVQSANKLAYIQPDLIEADEAHYLKNHRAGRTRRVARYMHEHPETRFVGVSGTVMKGSVRDFAHLLRWALKVGAPIPATDEEVEAWADALDDRVNPLSRRRSDALLELGEVAAPADRGRELAQLLADGQASDLTRARRAFQARLLETRGVVASPRSDGVACSLRVSALEYQPSDITEQHFVTLRQTWTTPDGWTFSEPVELRRYLRSLAVGFHSIWSPRPPPAWIEARRDWAAFVRDTLTESRTLDTELQVANAVDAGNLRTTTLGAWRQVRDSFQINPEPVWHDDAALEACARWMRDNVGIVWTEHVFFAERLAQLTGLPYYGAGGLTSTGQSITAVDGKKSIIASVQANATGRNLQAFAANLVTSWSPSAKDAEQLIGRTHRDGQEADTVTVDVLFGCREHYDAITRAIDGARAAADVLGHDQKLLLADICMPDISARRGPLWQ
jgi:hypothetical protein